MCPSGHCPNGAAWIDSSYVEQFVQELINPDAVVEHAGRRSGHVKALSVASTQTWGTGRKRAYSPHLPA